MPQLDFVVPMNPDATETDQMQRVSKSAGRNTVAVLSSIHPQPSKANPKASGQLVGFTEISDTRCGVKVHANGPASKFALEDNAQ
jgi:hypothetical protein